MRPISFAYLSTMSFGVPDGARIPYQSLTSIAGMPCSLNVATFGSVGARLSPVFNPDFELPPSNSGCDWRIRPLPGQTVSIEHGVAGAQGAVAALEFRRRPAAVAGLEQALLLAPGQHTLKVRQRTDQLRSDAGLEWIVACGDGRVLGRSERFGGSADWHTLSAPVQVPTDCPGQWLRLRNPAPTERTRVREGRLWSDRAWIVRDDA